MKKLRLVLVVLVVLMLCTLTACKDTNTIETRGNIEITKIEYNGVALDGLDLTEDTIAMPDLNVKLTYADSSANVADSIVVVIFMKNIGDGDATPAEMKLTKTSGKWATYFTDANHVDGVVTGDGYTNGKITAGGEAVVTFTLVKTASAITGEDIENAQLNYTIKLSITQ